MKKTLVVPISYVNDGSYLGTKMFDLFKPYLTKEYDKIDIYVDNLPESANIDIDKMVEKSVEFSQMVWEPTGHIIRFLSDADTVKNFLNDFVNQQ